MFSDNDYNSNMGIGTKIFGPIFWSMLHIISFNYPINPTEENKDDYHKYLMSIKNILPCKSCRNNYITNLKAAKYGRDKLKNREVFSRFIYDLHNTVNRMLGKKNFSTYEDVRDKYELFRAKCIDNTPTDTRIETGCTIPVNNTKIQSIIHIVPLKKNGDSFIIDKLCLKNIGSKASKKTSKKTSKKASKRLPKQKLMTNRKK
jgi:Erv1 / Alr family